MMSELQWKMAWVQNNMLLTTFRAFFAKLQIAICRHSKSQLPAVLPLFVRCERLCCVALRAGVERFVYRWKLIIFSRTLNKAGQLAARTRTRREEKADSRIRLFELFFYSTKNSNNPVLS